MRNCGRDRRDESRRQNTRQAKIKTFQRGEKKWRVTSVSLERALLSSIGQERGRGTADSALLCCFFSMENAASSKKFHHFFGPCCEALLRFPDSDPAEVTDLVLTTTPKVRGSNRCSLQRAFMQPPAASLLFLITDTEKETKMFF